MEQTRNPRTENEQRIAEEYLSSLADLNCNSKPLINMLTMLAEENIDYAAIIVKVVEQHIAQVPPDFKLPILYLIDSIVKNVKGTYVQLFSQCIVNLFCGVFEMVHEKIRERMYALRQTWNDVFSPQKLYALDVKVKRLDGNWPITAKQPAKPAIHVNPNFLKNVGGASTALPSEMEEILQVKTRELLELKKRKLELELEQTKKHLEEQEHQLIQTTNAVATNLPVPPGVMPPVVLGGVGVPTTVPFSPGMNARMAPPNVVSVDLIQQQQQQQQPQIAVFNQNFQRNVVRPPHLPPVQQQQPQNIGILSTMPGQGFPQVNNHHASNKPKVNPVNSALLNSVRQRDPRLSRQQQQLQQQQQNQLPPPSGRIVVDARSGGDSNNKSSSASHRHGSSNNTSKSNRSRSKSPNRHTSSSSSRSSGNIGRSSNKSSSSSNSSSRRGHIDKDRKRSESKSSSTSSSSSSSNFDRRKTTSSSAPAWSEHNKQGISDSGAASKHEYNSFAKNETVPSGKRKSDSSPPSSPNKPKRSSKSSSSSTLSSLTRRKATHSRSRSPNDYKDVDMRISCNNLTPEKKLTKMDIDSKLSPASSSSSASTAVSTVTAAAKSSVNTTMSTSATIDLEKPKFNILEPCAPPPCVAITSSSLDIDLRLLAPPPPSISNIATKINVVDEASSPSASSSSSSTNTTNNVVADTNFKTLPLSSSSSSSLDVAASSTLLKSQLDKNTSSSSSNNFNTINLTTTTISTTTTTTTTTSIKTTTLPSKVSFKIQKPFNKLEKSTANSASLTFTTTTSTSSAPVTATTTAAAAGSGNVSDAIKNSINKLMNNTQGNKEQHQQQTMMVVTGEKRTSGAALNSIDLSNEEPLQKKSKSTKIDMLFGSEDVDLRKEISTARTTPAFMVANTAKEDLSKLQATNDSWESEKKKNTISFDEIRAKLLKTAKSGGSKFNKSDKSSRDQAQRFKLAELNMNDDSQEANDDKIRTILSQAQEMLESNAMNQEQYKDLVQKMMAINEASKLKEAKRREALSSSQSNEPDVIVLDSPEDCERNAARDAVLRKRIPKLAKGSNDSPRSDGNNSPIYDDVVAHVVEDNANTTTVTAATTTSGKPSLHSKLGKEKRRKPSKWGEQVDPNTAQRVAWLANASAVAGSLTINNKRGSAFRASHNALQHPQLHNVAMRLNAPTPWQRNVVGGGGPVIPPQFVGMSIPIGTRSNIPPPPQPPNMIAMPPVPPNIPKPCNSIDNPQAEIMRSITIDGTSKDIRIYNQVAIVFMQGDVPHEIGFQPGQRSLIIDNMEPFTLQFNDGYKSITIDGILHHIRFGFPSRELYIDDHWYEIYFGGPPVSIPIRNKLHILKAEGPPPQVNIGAVRRDLVLGKINMIVDAHTIVPLFLDAKVQTFQLAEQQHTIQFVDSFLNVLFDGDLHQVEYGGLPKSIDLNGRKYFIRFGTLPHGVIPGKVQIQDMVYIKTEAPLPPPLQSDPAIVGIPAASNDLLMKVDAKPEQQQINEKSEPTVVAAVPTLPAALDKVNIDELFQKLVSSGIIGGATTTLPTAASAADGATSNAYKAITPVVTANLTITTNSDETNVNATTQPQAADVIPAIPTEPIRPIDLAKSDTIKTRQSAIIATIFSGMQCSSCGVRFPPEQTIRYSQHLDWHFRQNRRERDSSRKALSRKWYYNLSDWIQYEEIEDLEERDKNFMEATQNGPDAIDDTSNQRSLDAVPSPSCAAGPDDVDRACDMCHEKFEQFYNEELEEWHLRSAVRVEDKIYHPLCYEDYKASLNPPVVLTKTNKNESDVELNTTDDNAVDTVITIKSGDQDEQKDTNETLAATDIDDDDDVILLPNEEPSVMEIIDDDNDDGEYVPTNVTNEEASADDGSTSDKEAEAEGSQENEKPKALVAETPESDVEIQEPHIPFTDLDNYVEKELPELDESAQAALRNMKIKEEPKDDDYEDEDDGFEDVGTVLLVPGEEISIQSSEDTQTHTIASSASPVTERPSSVTSLTQQDALELELEPVVSEQSIIDINASMDGNLETQETHNLSSTGPAPALPMASLVNKIKINITKNTGSSSSSNSNNTNNNNNNNNNSTPNVTVTTSAATATSLLSSSSVLVSESNASQISVIGGGHHTTNIDKKISSSNSLGEVNSIQTISTIPVLCGGNTIVPKITTSSSSSNSTNNNNNSNISGTGSAPANISSISVIGSSYGNNNNSNMSRFTMMSKPSSITTSTGTTTSIIKPGGAAQSTSASATTSAKVAVAAATPVTARQSTPPPAAEPEPPIVLKPALRNVTFKKSKKVVNGIETSGLCSIM